MILHEDQFESSSEEHNFNNRMKKLRQIYDEDVTIIKKIEQNAKYQSTCADHRLNLVRNPSKQKHDRSRFKPVNVKPTNVFSVNNSLN